MDVGNQVKTVYVLMVRHHTMRIQEHTDPYGIDKIKNKLTGRDSLGAIIIGEVLVAGYNSGPEFNAFWLGRPLIQLMNRLGQLVFILIYLETLKI